MAKSNAKKIRDKMVREGKRNPEKSRSIYALKDLRTRKTKTKQEKLNRVHYEERLSDYSKDGMGGRFYYCFGFAFIS
ncbi:hypothetical protein [Bacillus thuringiensis]|uniref:hypothetical protein n=1 Tax=Bacillus thuringiensis TaxID=1428 RepID=UPI0021D64AB8|nr:hypothetical protein [Bacillus thuringiensis]MCU7667990.1 hypothetical protein [Bacillus thuringiensis]